jgi:hypothetical protein
VGKGSEPVGRDEGPLERSAADEELPVVARLVVEIRSDGSRTVARGAIEDRSLGQQVGLRVEGRTPLELALALARSVFSLPSLARGAARALRSAGRDRDKDE